MILIVLGMCRAVTINQTTIILRIIPTEKENNSSKLGKYLSVLLALSSIANAIYGNHSQIENLKLKTSCCELKRTDC